MVTPLKSKFATSPGSIIFHKKWKNTKLTEELKVKFNTAVAQDLGPYDFCLCDQQFVIYLSESELVINYCAEKFKHLKENDTLIIGIRNAVTAEQYALLQNKLVITHGYKMIPIGDFSELPELLFHLSFANSSITAKNSPTTELHSVQYSLLQNIPGLGKLKAEKLINTFGTINRIASSSVSELSNILGLTLATDVHKYFN